MEDVLLGVTQAVDQLQKEIYCECDFFFENEVCLEDVGDGDEVSGGVKHHASVREVWRVLNLRVRQSEN